MRFLIWLWVKGQLTSELTNLICWIRCRERSRFCHLDSHIDLQFFAVKKLQTKLQKYWLLSSDNIYFSKWQNTWWVKQVKKTNTGNPNTLSAITINVVLLTCVPASFLSRLEGICISEYYVICRFVNMTLRLLLKFRVTSFTITSHRGRHSQVSWQPCAVKIEKRDKGWNLTRTFVQSVTTVEWLARVVPGVDMCEETRDDGSQRRPLATISPQILHGIYQKRVQLFLHRFQTPRK